jgi:hypothetical protein
VWGVQDKLLRHLRRMQAVHGSVYSFFPPGFIWPREKQQLEQAVAELPDKVCVCAHCCMDGSLIHVSM